MTQVDLSAMPQNVQKAIAKVSKDAEFGRGVSELLAKWKSADAIKVPEEAEKLAERIAEYQASIANSQAKLTAGIAGFSAFKVGWYVGMFQRRNEYIATLQAAQKPKGRGRRNAQNSAQTVTIETETAPAPAANGKIDAAALLAEFKAQQAADLETFMSKLATAQGNNRPSRSRNASQTAPRPSASTMIHACLAENKSTHTLCTGKRNHRVANGRNGWVVTCPDCLAKVATPQPTQRKGRNRKNS